MNPDHWRQAKALFHEALELADAERGAFIDAAQVPPEILVEVKRLLGQHAAARTFLETPAAALDPSLVLSRASGSPGSDRTGPADEPASIGPYRILGRVGEGGMGVVYLAEQDSPRRTVALKVIRPGLASDSLLRRFEHEAQALARLQHPGIAQIYHAGTEGAGPRRRPYFAMELVQGEPLLIYAQTHALPTRDRAALFVRVCDAVQHAHIKGVIHRDLKPGNVIVGPDGQPKILDFGVARLTDSDIRATVQTDAGQIVGTVPYMSPEQIAGDPSDLDTRSDVYALGVVLYELLTGRLPYDLERKSIVEAARLIREQPPARLSAVSRTLRGDLDVIVGKALEKDKHRRYQSAAELGADLERYLRREPIAARPPSAMYQLRTFASRHRALVGAAALVVVVLVGALAGVLHQRNVARRHDARATALNDFFMRMLGAANPEQRHGKEMTVKEMLDEAAADLQKSPTGDAEVDEEIRLTLGVTYRQLGALDKSEPLLREAAERAEKELGPDHDVTLEALTTLALSLTDRGRQDQAGPLLERVYTTRLRQAGERDKDTLSAMNNWARWLDANGRQDEGLALMERAVKLRTELQGPDNRKTLIAVDNLGHIMLRHGRMEDAERYMRRANEGFRRTLGEDDPDTLASYQNLAELMRKLKRYPEAEECVRLAAEGRMRVQGPDDRFTLYSINTRGRILMDQGRAAEAEPFLKQALDGIRRITQPDDGSYPAGWGAVYARCLAAQSRFDEAETTLKSCEAALDAAAGDTAPVRKAVAEAYVALYTAWKRPEDAAAWQARIAPAP